MSEYTDIPWDDAPEEELPPAGEHPLRITGYEEGMSKGNPELGKPQRRMITVNIAVEGPIDYQSVRHWLVFPNKDEIESDEEDDRKKARQMLRSCRRFMRLFGMDETSFQADDLPGSTAHGTIYHQHDEDSGEDYPRLRLPRVK